MAPSSSDQNGAVGTATTLPLNSGSNAGAAIASRKAAMPAFGFAPSTPITPMTKGIFGTLKSFRTSRMNAAIHSLYLAKRLPAAPFGKSG